MVFTTFIRQSIVGTRNHLLGIAYVECSYWSASCISLLVCMFVSSISFFTVLSTTCLCTVYHNDGLKVRCDVSGKPWHFYKILSGCVDSTSPPIFLPFFLTLWKLITRILIYCLLIVCMPEDDLNEDVASGEQNDCRLVSLILEKIVNVEVTCLRWSRTMITRPMEAFRSRNWYDDCQILVCHE